ncbi:MAG TPA: hypothetical protein VGV37_13520 [Aliidongia sp.]|uniref:hypothetical protein n=1 Tax=Aliidongia sp. TaxID=1914230 RepID=UPI002DDD9282|nr:hypothetical protein [Aliidongia sp.]HEV2675557.1 hypothetical protein [Aliidongia sp.]
MPNELAQGVHLHVHLPPAAEDGLLAPPRHEHLHLYVHALPGSPGGIAPALIPVPPKRLLLKSTAALAAVALPVILVGLLFGRADTPAPAVQRASAEPAAPAAARPQVPAAVLNQLATPPRLVPPPGAPVAPGASPGAGPTAAPSGLAAFGLAN